MSSSPFFRIGRALPAVLFPVLILLFSAAANAQTKVDYEIAFPNAAHHEAEISVTFTGIPVGKPLQARMGRSSPGRYATHEFAKNVYSVKAFDARGRSLNVSRPNPYQWDVTGHKGTVKITYTLFADYASGTYSGVDNTHAHLNMPATFMWARGFDNAPVHIIFRPLVKDWKVATQLVPTKDPYTFTAPHFQYFMDSITEVSDFKSREWTVNWGGKKYTYRLAVHDSASEKDVDDFTEMLKKVVAEEDAIFGEPADYDYGTYTFIACYMPGERQKRKPTWSQQHPEGRWRAFSYDEIIARDKVSLDVSWLRDESLEDSANLPDPNILAQEIADDLRSALGQIEDILGDLERRVAPPAKISGGGT